MKISETKISNANCKKEAIIVDSKNEHNHFLFTYFNHKKEVIIEKTNINASFLHF